MDLRAQHDVNVGGMGDEVVRAVHGTKSYVGSSILTLILYYIGFYIIGLIANLLFLSQANHTQRITGDSPPGRGCLLFLVWIHLGIPVLIILLLMGVITMPGFGCMERYRQGNIEANESSAIVALRAYVSAQSQFKRSDYYDIGQLVYASPDSTQGIGNGYPDLYRIGYKVRASEGTGPVLKLIHMKFANAHCDRGADAKPMSGYLFDDLEGVGGYQYDFTIDCGLCAVPAEYGVTGRNTFIVDVTGTVYQQDTGGQPVRRYPSASGLRRWRPIGYR